MENREQILSRASVTLSLGRPEAAARDLRAFLADHAEDVDARYYYARSLAAQGNLEAAVREYQRLLSVRPDHWHAMVEMSIAWCVLGNPRVGMAALEPARRINPDGAQLYFALGLCLFGLDNLAQAEASFRTAIERGMRTPEVYDQLGSTLFRLQRYSEAAECYRQAVARNPRFASACANLGDALIRMGDGAAAVHAYRDAILLQPDDALVHAALGTALLYTGQLQAATSSLERALALNPQQADIAFNLGTAQRRLGLDDRAAKSFAHVLTINPAHADALLALGGITADRGDPQEAVRLLLAARDQRPASAETALSVAEKLDLLGHCSEALEVYEQAAQRSPNPEIADACGRLLFRLGRYREALTWYGRALELDPSRRLTRLNRAQALEVLGAIPEAIECQHEILNARPTDEDAIAGLLSCAVRICDWTLADAMAARLLATPTGIDKVHPFLRFAVDVEPSVLAASARRTALAVAARTSETPIAFPVRDRLRIAYLSPDFRQHPVAYALAGVIARHDRERFEVLGAALVAPDESDIAKELKASFDDFIDCSALGDRAIVEMLRRREIDIAVDLGGFTAGARPELFASRVAPVQVNYLGYPGSMGASFMDFLIADETVVPEADAPLYAEKIFRLPNTYLPFDRQRTLGTAPLDRAAVGLPADGIVFCGFSNGYKVTRRTFEIWMRLLGQVPHSVLWLRGGHPVMEQKLRQAAGEQGISLERLVFAPFVPQMDQHLRRLQLADLFLDTAPYNSHTTAAEALWAGVPVITRRGRSFASRVGASVLLAAGLPELVCADEAGYFDQAITLARSPGALAELRERLRAARPKVPLFDTAQYVRDLEAAYSDMRRRNA
jgi:protein O-GlcNAc transferase